MAFPTRPLYKRAPVSAASTRADPSPGNVSPVSAPSITGEEASEAPVAKVHSDSNPFASPIRSRVPSRMSSFQKPYQAAPSKRYFRSRRVKKDQVSQPWKDQKHPREIWVGVIPLIGLILGLGISAFLIWDGFNSVVNHQYCPILDENFANGFDAEVWTKEAELGGFGNGQFEETTSTDEQVFVQDGMLHIKPTLSDPKDMQTNWTLDLRNGSICTSPDWFNCYTSTNTTNGTIVPPVKSGRINTKRSHIIRYGRIEVTAKLPRGDWLWPAIWLLPVNDTYGAWPASGEIDIIESRGNNHTYAQGGNNIASSALHWGPTSDHDAWWRTYDKRRALHTTFADGFHTFGLEWSERYIFTYIDSRLLQVLYVNFEPGTNLWDKGKFPAFDEVNGTGIKDPWYHGGEVVPSRPFDQDFYLILNVAVGGTNGWFEDGELGKPWVDTSKTPRRDFWDARDEWLPTWEEGGAEMVVKRVRMWQQEGYNGCMMP